MFIQTNTVYEPLVIPEKPQFAMVDVWQLKTYFNEETGLEQTKIEHVRETMLNLALVGELRPRTLTETTVQLTKGEKDSRKYDWASYREANGWNWYRLKTAQTKNGNTKKVFQVCKLSSHVDLDATLITLKAGGI